MKCEICHERDAARAVTVKRDGKDCELYVCQVCAQNLKKSSASKKKSTTKPSVTVVGPGEEPPPFVKNFLEATLGLVKGMSESPEETHLVCPTCHRTWSKIKETKRFGCPTCWKTFAKEIQSEFFRPEYGPSHIGEAPTGETTGGAAPVESRTQLERALKAAIAAEDYHKAAEIKKRLDALGKGESAS